MSVDSIDGINIIRDFLRDNLEDPYVLAGGKPRASWIFTDDPFSSATYPRIKIDLHNHTASPMDIGSDYTNWEHVVVMIRFFTKRDFKVEIDSKVISNEQLVYKYQNKIHDKLKTNFNSLYSSGVKGFRLIGFSQSAFDSEYQSHTGYVLCKFWLFRK